MEDKDSQLIEAFLEGSLSGEELQQFKIRLQQEPELMAELNLYKEVDQRLEAFHKERLITEWKQHLEEKGTEDKDKKTIPLRTYGIIGVAAAILILLWLSPIKNMLYEGDPYEKYFAHLPRDNANLSSDTEIGRQAYDQQNYKRAFPALLQEVEEGGDSLNLIYAGVAAIGSRQAEKAIPVLEPLLDAEGWKLYQAEIRWYLALAYLQEDEPVKAQNLLNNLAASPGAYSTDAAALLETINE